MGQFFRLTPPSVHQMILALERRGLITREPGMARSIRLTLQPEQLPPLREAITMVSVSQIANQYDSGYQATMLRLGKIQIDDLFALNLQRPPPFFVPRARRNTGSVSHPAETGLLISSD